MLKRFLRKSEIGQSIVLLALGFVALAAFVGITTDLSIAFVRYSQLSRAVDSAAIAAANQMRQDTSLATVGLAARQFIEFHGITPEQVDVVTCLTAPGDPELCADDQAKLVRVVAFIESPTVFMRLVGYQNFDLWASAVSQTAALDVVLIMDVSESMLTDTTVQDWAYIETIGRTFDEVTKVERLGVVYRPPTIYEILNRKSIPYADSNLFGVQIWENDLNPDAPGLLNNAQQVVNDRLTYSLRSGGANGDPNPPSGSAILRDPDYLVVADDTFFLEDPLGLNFPNDVKFLQQQPREECRVRFYPSSVSMGLNQFGGYIDPNTEEVVSISQMYAARGYSLPASPFFPNRFEGFVPAYNFYGCCNDPDGVNGFDDLVCQPFKQARDATFQFLERIDFVRGDRATFVTFDRAAFLVNPYGVFSQGPATRPGAMIDNANDAFLTVRNLIGVRAEPNYYVFEPDVVTVTPDGGGGFLLSGSPLTAYWSSFAAGIDDNGASIPINYQERNVTNTAGVNALNYMYPVIDNCPFRNAGGLPTFMTLFDYALSNVGLPNEFNSTDGDAGWANWTALAADGGGGLETSASSNAQRVMDMRRNYEYWASCRGTNIGAALREGNNALLNPETTRRFGTVWVMVLLSDGAAGASDPVRRNGRKLITTEPFESVTSGGTTTFGIPGEYGAFGLCPFGTPSNYGRLVHGAGFPFCSDEAPWTRNHCDFRPLRTLPRFGNDQTALQDEDYVVYNDPAYTPSINGSGVLIYTHPVTLVDFEGPQSAADEIPWNRDRGNLHDIDLGAPGDYTECHELYDVDDYARDWADYIGLQDLQGNDNTLLPTIFTIGFGLDFADRTNSGGGALDITNPDDAVEICIENAADCLGEQLLRYIADVGDNNAIDNDFYQDYLEEGAPGSRQLDGFLNNGSFGPRGRCQRDDQGHSSGSYTAVDPPSDNSTSVLSSNEFFIQWGQLPPQQSCGNYFFAPDGNELQFVFDEIASRMFTRLSR